MKNAYLLAKFDADTAENERNFAKFAKKSATTLPYPRRAGPPNTSASRCRSVLKQNYGMPGSVCDGPLRASWLPAGFQIGSVTRHLRNLYFFKQILRKCSLNVIRI